jgi:hypothetical protein
MGGFFELSYLFLIWLIDGYGTSPMHLFVTILASIVLFSPAYLPVSKLLHKAKSETAASSSTKKHWMDYGRVYITAIAISLEATFAVIERIPGLPDVVKIIKGQTNSLFLSQYLRIVYCAQALFGAFMMARGIRIWLLFFS